MTSDVQTELISEPLPKVAIAILYQDGKFLMQLRDDNPDILYPGHWGFFGGQLMEELSYCPPILTLFDCHQDTYVIRYVYHGQLDKAVNEMVLGEGMDLEWFTPEDIERGDRYSAKINQVRPLGKPHREILLNFIKSAA